MTKNTLLFVEFSKNISIEQVIRTHDQICTKYALKYMPQSGDILPSPNDMAATIIVKAEQQRHNKNNRTRAMWIPEMISPLPLSTKFPSGCVCLTYYRDFESNKD